MMQVVEDNINVQSSETIAGRVNEANQNTKKVKEKSPEQKKKELLEALREEKEFMTLRASIAKAYFEQAYYSVEFNRLVNQQQSPKAPNPVEPTVPSSENPENIANTESNESEGNRTQESD